MFRVNSFIETQIIRKEERNGRERGLGKRAADIVVTTKVARERFPETPTMMSCVNHQ